MTFTQTLIAACLLAVVARAQETRTEEIEAARDAKSATLTPDLPSKFEQRLIRFKDDKVMERLSAGFKGFKLTVGGMSPGSGFATGTHYVRTLKHFTTDAVASVSTKGWTKLEFGVATPKTSRWILEARAARYDYESLRYVQGDTTNHLDSRTVDLLAGVHLGRKLALGGGAGWQSGRIRNADQADYFRTGTFAQFDSRDNPDGPRSGSMVVARFDDYRARDEKPFDFRRLDIEGQHYIPFFNGKRVIALRARTVQAFTEGNNRVPFFHQSVLGGSDDLRGFDTYRFQDDNLMVMNAEYRWEVFSGLDMAVFGDAGRVSPKRWDFKPSELKTSVGFGLRFNAANVPVLRVDTAFSHEGFQVWLRFTGIFRNRRLNTSSAAHIF